MDMIEIDGSQGEVGGQILRSALSLSAITGQAFRIKNIRAKRKKPGLLRQHLTAVEAAAKVCGAQVEGAQAKATELTFHPGNIQAGDYSFAIGSAGSALLVLQTVLPILWHAAGPSRLTVSGGTHNPMAPPVEFFSQAWLPLMAKMGALAQFTLVRPGFFPAGGGEVSVEVSPCTAWESLDLTERGALQGIDAHAIISAIPDHVVMRETNILDQALPLRAPASFSILPEAYGPGNALYVRVEHEAVTEIFSALGEFGKSAETVARSAVHAAKMYLDARAAVDEYLADQLVLPLASAGQGRFSARKLTPHFHTNAAVVQQFLPVTVQTKTLSSDMHWVFIEPGSGKGAG